MKLSGLTRLIRGQEAVPDPASDQEAGGSGASRPGSDTVGPATGGPPEVGLELEKRWLQLARVDAEQFREFYDRYHDGLFRFLALRTEDEETAQDLTQDVFMFALEHLQQFNWQGYSFDAWLFHIARKRVLPRYRRAGRRKSEEMHLRRRPDDAGSPDAGLERAELQARVRRLVARFPDERHDIFVLHVFMELSVRDTALAMGLPQETVRSHLRRGRVQLAEWLRDDQALTADERRCLSEELAREQGLSVLPESRLRRQTPKTATGSRAKGGDDDEGGDHHD